MYGCIPCLFEQLDDKSVSESCKNIVVTTIRRNYTASRSSLIKLSKTIKTH